MMRRYTADKEEIVFIMFIMPMLHTSCVFYAEELVNRDISHINAVREAFSSNILCTSQQRNANFSSQRYRHYTAFFRHIEATTFRIQLRRKVARRQRHVSDAERRTYSDLPPRIPHSGMDLYCPV